MSLHVEETGLHVGGEFICARGRQISLYVREVGR